MATTDIPRDEWSDFFDQLGLRYEGWRVTVETVETGDDEEDLETRECSIEAMSAELENGDGLIVISFADDAPLTIVNPVRVSMAETDEGRDNLLEIESETGVARLWLRFPANGDGTDEEEEGLDEW